MKTGIRQENTDQARKLTIVNGTSEDYRLATHRLIALTNCLKDHAAAQELNALLNALLKAVQTWDAKQGRALEVLKRASLRH